MKKMNWMNIGMAVVMASLLSACGDSGVTSDVQGRWDSMGLYCNSENRGPVAIMDPKWGPNYGVQYVQFTDETIIFVGSKDSNNQRLDRSGRITQNDAGDVVTVTLDRATFIQFDSEGRSIWNKQDMTVANGGFEKFSVEYKVTFSGNTLIMTDRAAVNQNNVLPGMVGGFIGNGLCNGNETQSIRFTRVE